MSATSVTSWMVVRLACKIISRILSKLTRFDTFRTLVAFYRPSPKRMNHFKILDLVKTLLPNTHTQNLLCFIRCFAQFPTKCNTNSLPFIRSHGSNCRMLTNGLSCAVLVSNLTQPGTIPTRKTTANHDFVF